MSEETKIEELQSQYDNTLELFKERITQLELALEDFNWYRIIGESQYEFSRQGLRMISQMARIMFLKNPLVKRGVLVTSYYVFGQGVTINSPDPDVNRVIQDFLQDVKNRSEIGRQQALISKEHELEVQGNLFFCFFANESTGRVLVRTISLEEIENIICNPQDRKDPWYYHRIWTEEVWDPDRGAPTTTQHDAYYPDINHNPTNKPEAIGGSKIHWESPVYHLKVGGLPDMKFGLCEFYAAQDWAKAYTDFLQAWSQITQSLARFAWKRKTKGPAAITAEKTKLSSTVSTSSIESNPPPVAGAVAFTAEGTDLEPIKTAGAQTSMEDGRRLLLMAAAVFGLPETFFGDVSVGTLATANSLDRPTELKMRDRQTLWTDVIIDILNYVLLKATTAVSGPLNGKAQAVMAEDGTYRVYLANGKPLDVRVNWPPILEHATKDAIAAIVQAATLNSPGNMANTLDPETVTRLLCTALGVKDVDAVLNALGENLQAADNAELAAQESSLAEAAQDLREAIVRLKEIYASAH